jgi:hypothetical protein
MLSFLFGKDHLPPAQTDDLPDSSLGGTGYAKGIVDEADRWTKETSSSAGVSDIGTSNSKQSSRTGQSSFVEASSAFTSLMRLFRSVDVDSLLWDSGDTILVGQCALHRDREAFSSLSKRGWWLQSMIRAI